MPLSTPGQLPAYSAPGAEDITVNAGDGTTTHRNGALLTVRGGNGQTIAPVGDGGTTEVQGGSGPQSGGSGGGNLQLTSGDGDATPGSGGFAGDVLIETGIGDTASRIAIIPQVVETGNGSRVEIESGGTNDAATSGDISLTTGAAPAGTQGDISLTADQGSGASGNVKVRGPFRPSTPAHAFQLNASLYAGVGAPANGNGADGDMYFRSDGGALTTIYQKRAGAWVGIV